MINDTFRSYGPLSNYYASNSVEGCEGRGKQLFRDYMEGVKADLRDLLSDAGSNNKNVFMSGGDTLAVFGPGATSATEFYPRPVFSFSHKASGPLNVYMQTDPKQDPKFTHCRLPGPPLKMQIFWHS